MGPTSRILQRRRSSDLFLAAGWAILRRPWLWPEALRQVPAAASGPYRAFRSVTAYGDPQRRPATADIVAWLRWARSFRRVCVRKS